MKRILSLIGITLVCVLTATGCNNTQETTNETNDSKRVITVGASPTPHGEILEVAKAELAEKGITLEIKEFNDYVIPNKVTDSGEIDANFFQHGPYLENFNEENGTSLVPVAEIHYEPFAIYKGKVDSIEALKDGSAIAVPNDGTNEGRALKLLEAQGIIKLRDNVGFTATKIDIVENPLNIDIKEIEAAQLARALSDVDLSVINGNYAIQAGLSVANDTIVAEDKESDAAKTYVNVLVVKEGNESNEDIIALVEALKSDKVKTFIEERFEGAVVPMF